jgi:hypothetical protein
LVSLVKKEANCEADSGNINLAFVNQLIL